MSDVQLFRWGQEGVELLRGRPVKLERELQLLMEKNLERFLAIRFVASEYSTGKAHSGRIDTLGLDENGCPVIIEYKRASNANVINQGLFYLDWLLDHQAEFGDLVRKRFGEAEVAELNFESARLICVAEDFTRYDTHAIQQIDRNIELIRYAFFANDLLLLDWVAGSSQSASPEATATAQKEAVGDAKAVFEALRAFLLDLGDDVQEHTLKHYIAYKRLKNFATVQVRKNRILVWLTINPTEVALEEGFTRDVRNVGHLGTGDLEVALNKVEDIERAAELIRKSFAEN